MSDATSPFTPKDGVHGGTVNVRYQVADIAGP